MDHFSLEGRKWAFTPNSLVFLFDNSSWCYLGFDFIFPTALYILALHPCVHSLLNTLVNSLTNYLHYALIAFSLKIV